MIIDSLLNVSRSQVVTANAASTDVIDTGAGQQPIGPGERVWLICVIKAVSGTSPTLQISLQSATDAAFTTPITGVSSGVIAPPVAGQRIALAVPMTNARFLRANYTVGGTSPSFTIDAFLSDDDPAAWSAFPDGI